MRIGLKFAMRKLWNHFARRVLLKAGHNYRGYQIFNVIDTRRKSREFLNEAQLPRFVIYIYIYVCIFPCDRFIIVHFWIKFSKV